MHSLAMPKTPLASIHGVQFPGSQADSHRQGHAFEGSWTAPSMWKAGFGKHAKWVLFHPHQLEKLGQQNMN